MDLAVAAYAVLAGIALAFPHRPEGWPVTATALLALLAAALLFHRARRDPGRWLGTRVRRVVSDWYPLLVIPMLYSQLDTLNTAVWDGRFFDAAILGIEERLFGGQPSATMAAAAPWLALSEPLHAAYLSYYPIIYLPPLALYLRGDRDAYTATLLPLALGFLLHYLVFIYFPVQGPRYLFPAPGGAIADGFMYQLAHDVLEAGSSRGAAFPSSHMAIAVIQTVAAFRFLPRAAPVVLLATVGLGVGAVYGGFHYATDMIAGALTGLAIALPFAVRARRDGRRGGSA